MTKALSSAVKDISQLALQADVKETLEQYDITVSSDLDRIVQNAAGKMVNELATKFGAELQSAISAKIAEPMKQLKTNMAGFDGLAGDLSSRLLRKGKTLGFPDLLIAALAQQHSCSVYSLDQDFRQIPGLSLYVPGSA